MSVRNQQSDTSRVVKNPLFNVAALGIIEELRLNPVLLPAAAPFEDEPEHKGKFLTHRMHCFDWNSARSGGATGSGDDF